MNDENQSPVKDDNIIKYAKDYDSYVLLMFSIDSKPSAKFTAKLKQLIKVIFLDYHVDISRSSFKDGEMNIIYAGYFHPDVSIVNEDEGTINDVLQAISDVGGIDPLIIMHHKELRSDIHVFIKDGKPFGRFYYNGKYAIGFVLPHKDRGIYPRKTYQEGEENNKFYDIYKEIYNNLNLSKYDNIETVECCTERLVLESKKRDFNIPPVLLRKGVVNPLVVIDLKFPCYL
jgi:hypothetical protein